MKKKLFSAVVAVAMIAAFATVALAQTGIPALAGGPVSRCRMLVPVMPHCRYRL